MPDGFATWGVSGVAEAPPLEPAEAESAPGERLASLAFWARRARFASRALLSSSPLRSASSTVGDGHGRAGGGDRRAPRWRDWTRVQPWFPSTPPWEAGSDAAVTDSAV